MLKECVLLQDTLRMKKITKSVSNGMVDVILSKTGWYTFLRNEELLFDAELIHKIKIGTPTKELIEYCNKKYGEGFYLGLEQAFVAQVPVGERFLIMDGDDGEYILKKEDVKWIMA